MMQGYLILTEQKPRPEPEEQEVVTTLRQTCKKLSARKQQQSSVAEIDFHRLYLMVFNTFIFLIRCWERLQNIHLITDINYH